MTKTKVMPVAVLALLVGSLGLWVSAQTTQKRTMVVTAEELNRLKLEQAQAEATTIKPGEMDPKLKKHSGLYKNYGGSEKLTRLIQTEEIILMGRCCGDEGRLPNEPPFDLHNVLQKMAMDSSAVIVGTVEKKASQLTEDENYVFTDYEIAVEHVLKDDNSNPIRKQGRITLSRSGGSVLLDGHLIWATDDDFLPLQQGLKYLLFLKSIPDDPGSYQSLNRKSSFLLYDNRIFKLTKAPFPFPATESTDVDSGSVLKMDVDSFVAAVCAAIASK